MEKDFDELLKTLKYQLAVYEKFLSLAQAKQPVLLKGDISELDKITKEEEVLILKVGRLEEQRSFLYQTLANHFALSAEDTPFSELLAQTEFNTEGFHEVLVKLSEVLNQISELNKSNSDLIKNSLEFINFSFNLITSDDYAPGYGDQEEEKKVTLAKLFDQKI